MTLFVYGFHCVGVMAYHTMKTESQLNPTEQMKAMQEPDEFSKSLAAMEMA